MPSAVVSDELRKNGRRSHDGGAHRHMKRNGSWYFRVADCLKVLERLPLLTPFQYLRYLSLRDLCLVHYLTDMYFFWPVSEVMS